MLRKTAKITHRLNRCKRSLHRPSPRRKEFIDNLFNVFDISHEDLLKLIEASEKKNLLSITTDEIKQRLTHSRTLELQGNRDSDIFDNLPNSQPSKSTTGILKIFQTYS